MDVQIYTTPTCGYCLNAKNWFKEHGIEYTEHSLVNDEDRLEFIQRVNNVEEKLGKTSGSIKSVPQIFVNGERIGGYTQLLESSEKILKKRGGGLYNRSKLRSLGATNITSWFNALFGRGVRLSEGRGSGSCKFGSARRDDF